MMTSIETYVRRGRGTVKQWASRPWARMAGTFCSGFFLSAGGLAGSAMPLGLGLLLGATGLRAAVMALGSCAGYALFWGKAGYQGLVWTLAGLGAAWLLGKRQQGLPLLGAIGAFLLSAVGLAFRPASRASRSYCP